MSKQPDDEEVYTLERVELSDDSDDDFNYKVISDDSEEDEYDEEDEDFETALRTVKAAAAGELSASPAHVHRPTTSVRPAVVDDFLRNFLIKRNMTRTLDAFNTEWYELQAKGKLSEEDIGVVPDIYLRNEDLDEQVKTLRVEVEKMKEIAARAQGTWDKFRKERDFHRMHHKRVVQEKNKLILDIKRLKKHFSSYEPTLNELRNKYETAMKEKMLMRLERDRLGSKISAMEVQVTSMEEAQSKNVAGGGAGGKGSGGRGGGAGGRRRRGGRGKEDTPLPSEDAVNPFLSVSFDPVPARDFTLTKTFKGHLNSVAALAFHPKKQIIATGSDDHSWKLWSVPNGDLIMSGEGHSGWVAGLDFHPRGTHLATASGDCTVKLWDFVNASCARTFSDHTQAVWGVAFHHGGDFLASCSMDHTARLWDTVSGRCRQTFRGHVDSVNSVTFQPFSHNVCTASGDKTVSLWDIRSGLCIQTFYGHMNSCNDVAFNLRGDTIASCDADGVVKLWDVRMVAERSSLSAGQHPVNKLAFDRSGTILASASDDGSIKVFDTSEGVFSDLRGHDEAVQTVVFDPLGKYLVSGSSDCTFRVWSL